MKNPMPETNMIFTWNRVILLSSSCSSCDPAVVTRPSVTALGNPPDAAVGTIGNTKMNFW